LPVKTKPPSASVAAETIAATRPAPVIASATFRVHRTSKSPSGCLRNWFPPPSGQSQHCLIDQFVLN
jgi:hypothetical protein